MKHKVYLILLLFKCIEIDDTLVKIIYFIFKITIFLNSELKLHSTDVNVDVKQTKICMNVVSQRLATQFI